MMNALVITIEVLVAAASEHSRFRQNDAGLGDDGPFLLWDVVLVDVNVVAIGVEAVVEDQRSVHEAAGVDKATTLAKLHFLNVEHEAAVEDVEGSCALSTEQQNLVIGDLVGEAHVAGHPARLVDLGRSYFLPDVARDVVDLDGVHNPFLVDTTSECKDVVVLEDTEGGSGAGHTHISNKLPFVLLGVVYLTVAINLIANERANDIDKVLDCADRVVCVRVVHVGHGV